MEIHKIVFFKSALDTFDKLIWFTYKEDLYNYFDNLPNKLESKNVYNITLLHATINTPFNYHDLLGCNSGYVVLENGDRLFFRLSDILDYKNPTVTTVSIVLDYLQSYSYGDKLQSIIPKGKIIRQQYEPNELENKEIIENVRTQLDFIHYGKMAYVKQFEKSLTGFWCLLQSSVDLSDVNSFGDEENPTLKSSSGGTFDKISSPVDLYLISSEGLPKLMEEYKIYPWVTMNITNVTLVPTDFIDSSNWETVKSGDGYDLKKFKEGTGTPNYDFLEIPLSELYNSTKLTPELFGQDNANIHITNFQGQAIDLELNKINITEKDSLTLRNSTTSGYTNEFVIYPTSYNSVGENSESFPRGDFSENAIIFNTFDSVPVQINKVEGDYIKQAYQRRSQRFGTLDGASDSLTNQNMSTSEKIANVSNTVYNNLGSLTSVGNAFRGLTTATMNTATYKYQQQNDQKTRDLEPQSISQQTFSNYPAIANERFGVTVKIKAYSDKEIKQMIRYYNKFGYNVNDFGNFPEFGRRLIDYVQFDTDALISEIPLTHQNFVKEQLKKGVLVAIRPKNNNPFNIDYYGNIRTD